MILIRQLILSVLLIGVAVVPAPGAEPDVRMQIMYQQVWSDVLEQYYDRSLLKDWDKQEHAYDNELVDINHLNIALKKMLSATGDQWTKYISDADVRAFAQRKNDGILDSGLHLYKRPGMSDYQVDVIDYGSPAYHAAIQERQLVHCINGIDISNLSKDRVDDMLRGKAGTPIVVRLDNGGEVHLTLAPADADEVTGKLLPGNIARIRLPTFAGETAAQQWIAKFKELQAQATGPIQGAILDLENNQGGDDTTAIKFVSLFIGDENAVVLKSITRAHGQTDVKVVKPSLITFDHEPVDPAAIAFLQKVPLVVTVNGSSASASEIAVGALKDNHRAVIKGKRTFGKGVGYKTKPGPVGGLIDITEFGYLTPSGYSVQGRGIEPDIAVPMISDSNSAE